MIIKTTVVPLPINVQPKDLYLFLPYLSYENAPLKTKKFKNVFVTHSGFCLNERGLIKECHHDHPYQFDDYLAEAAYYYHDAEAHPEKLIELNDKEYLLIHHPWFNYYHWICEAIPRLWRVRIQLDALTLILPETYLKSDFIMGSLKPFDIKNIFPIPNGKSLFIKNLRLPQIKPLCDAYDAKEMHSLRKFYLNYIRQANTIAPIKKERIYLSRKKASRKKVINEAEIEPILIKYGFTILDNEDYTFVEQVAIYSNVKYLVSIHGSGLTNMLFMPEGGSILEIHKIKTNQLDRPSFVFWYQAHALGHHFLHQISDPLTPNDDYFHGDFYINPEELDQNLKLMLS